MEYVFRGQDQTKENYYAIYRKTVVCLLLSFAKPLSCANANKPISRQLPNRTFKRIIKRTQNYPIERTNHAQPDSQ